MKALALATAMVAVAGWVDAIGYLHFGHLFVSFMSGNTTIFAIHAGLGEVDRMLAPILAIIAFVLGAFLGTIVAQAGLSLEACAVLATEAALVGFSLAVQRWGGVELLSFCLLATAMGAQNATLREVGRTRVSLTYVTGSLVGLGRGLARLATGAEKSREWMLFGMLWLALASGAVGGAAVYETVGFDALAVPFGTLAVLLALTLAPPLYRLVADKLRGLRS